MKPHIHEYVVARSGDQTPLCYLCGRPKEVTKGWLAKRLELGDFKRVIGKALAAIYSRQTDAEKSYTVTRMDNGIGFSKPDARVGSIGARQYKDRGFIDGWVAEVWMTKAKDDLPRICKYARQLNEIAEEKNNRYTSENVTKAVREDMKISNPEDCYG